MDHASVLTNPDNADSPNSVDDVLLRLKVYSRLLDESQSLGRLLDKAERFREKIPSSIFDNVRRDYLDRKEEVDRRLEEEKGGFWERLKVLFEQKSTLERTCTEMTDRIRELNFRYVLGEHTPEEIEAECSGLRRRFVQSLHTLRCLDEAQDMFEIMGLEAPAAPQALQEDPPEDSPERYDFTRNLRHGETYAAAYGVEDAEALAEPAEEGEWPEDDEEDRDVEGAPLPEERCLAILNGSRQGDQVPLIQADITIGKAPGNDIQLSDPEIADHHVRILYQDRKHFIQSIGAFGRCTLNGEETEHAELQDGDLIGLGDISIQVALVRET